MSSPGDSVSIFVRFLEERFRIFKDKIEELVNAVAGQTLPAKVEACNKALASLKDLKRNVSSKDYPQWIGPVEHRLESYIKNHNAPNAGPELLRTLIKHYESIVSHEWVFNDAKNVDSIDFDNIYHEYYNSSRLPELFQHLIDQIQEIVDSGQIDSIRVIESLEKLILTIKRNIRSSYFSTIGTYDFSVTLFYNFIDQVLSDVPGIGHLHKAIKQTFIDLDAEMKKVHDEMKSRVKSDYSQTLPMLDYKPRARGQIEDHTKE